MDILKYFETVFEKRKLTLALEDIEDRQTVDDMIEGKDLEELTEFIEEVEESIVEAEQAIDYNFWQTVLVEVKLKIAALTLKAHEEKIT